jgi:hypothetical protein
MMETDFEKDKISIKYIKFLKDYKIKSPPHSSMARRRDKIHVVREM